MRCEHPITVKGKLVSCGKCLSCRSANTNNWIARFMCESDAFKRGAFFGTLTYNDESLPEGGNLDEKAVALYWKRVKKELGLYGIGFVYTYCGEYGTRRGRPHYHFICAGMSDGSATDVQISKFKEVLERQWCSHNKNSFVYIQEIRTPEASIRYLINYTNKVCGWYAIHPGESKVDFTKRTGLVAPFVRFSQGISKDYYKNNKDKLATAEYLQFGKHKFCIPRYFRKQLERDRTSDQHVTTLSKVVEFCTSELKKKYKFKDFLGASFWKKTIDQEVCSPFEVCERMNVFPICELAQVLSTYRKYCYDLQRVKAKYYTRWRKEYDSHLCLMDWRHFLKERTENDLDYLAEIRNVRGIFYLDDFEVLEVRKLIDSWNDLFADYRFLMKDTIIQSGINQKFKILAKTEKMYYAKNIFLD